MTVLFISEQTSHIGGVAGLQVVNVLVDNERMRMTRRPRYAVVALTNHWRVIDGTPYRECRMLDRRTGQVRMMSVRDELLPAVAA